jgi:methyl-accepting chemotaxis protein
MPEDKLISESIVKMVFDQLRDSIKQNSEMVNKMTEAVHDLTKSVTTKKDLEDEVYSLEQRTLTSFSQSDERKKELVSSLEKNAKNIKDDIDKSLKEIKAKVDETAASTRELKDRVSKMMWIVGIVMSLIVVAYFFVRASVDTQINKSIEEAVKKVVTSRPYSDWPVQQPDEKSHRGK